MREVNTNFNLCYDSEKYISTRVNYELDLNVDEVVSFEKFF